MLENKTIIITGGAGFIGSALIKKFFSIFENIRIINIDKLTYAGTLSRLNKIEQNKNYIFEKVDICNKEALRDIFNKSLVNKISYKLIEKDLKKLKDQVNPDMYNGATLIGLNGISVKSHGNANPIAFSYALKQCHNFITNDLNKQIIKSIKSI